MATVRYSGSFQLRLQLRDLVGDPCRVHSGRRLELAKAGRNGCRRSQRRRCRQRGRCRRASPIRADKRRYARGCCDRRASPLPLTLSGRRHRNRAPTRLPPRSSRIYHATLSPTSDTLPCMPLTDEYRMFMDVSTTLWWQSVVAEGRRGGGLGDVRRMLIHQRILCPWCIVRIVLISPGAMGDRRARLPPGRLPCRLPDLR